MARSLKLSLLPEALSKQVKQTYDTIERENQLINLYTNLEPERFRTQRPEQFRQWIELCRDLLEALQALITRLDEAAVDALSQEAAAGAQTADAEKKNEALYLQRLSLIISVIGVVSTLVSNTIVGIALSISMAAVFVIILLAVFGKARTASSRSNYWSRNLLAVNALRSAVMTTYLTLLGTLQGVAIYEHQGKLEEYFQKLLDEYERRCPQR